MHLLVLNLFWAGCFLQEERKNLKGGLFGLGSKFSHYLVGRVHPTELQKDNLLKTCTFSRVGSAHHKEDETAVGTQWGGRSERNSNARLTSTKLQFNSFALSQQSVQTSLNFRMSPFVDT